MIAATEKPNISLAKVSLEGDRDINILVKQIGRQVRVTEARLLNETEVAKRQFF